MSMHCNINMYNSKLLYQFKHNNLVYLDYDNNCFDNDECDFKVKIIVGM